MTHHDLNRAIKQLELTHEDVAKRTGFNLHTVKQHCKGAWSISASIEKVYKALFSALQRERIRWALVDDDMPVGKWSKKGVWTTYVSEADAVAANDILNEFGCAKKIQQVFVRGKLKADVSKETWQYVAPIENRPKED